MRKPVTRPMLFSRSMTTWCRRMHVSILTPTSGDRRYINNYLVTKSEMAPLFKALGIKGGWQLRNAFTMLGPVRFYEFIYFLYAINYENEAFMQVDNYGIHDLFMQGNFRIRSSIVRNAYFELRHEMRQAYDRSKGTSRTPSRIPKEVLRVHSDPLKSTRPDVQYRELNPASVAVGLTLRGDGVEPHTQKYIEANRSMITNKLVQDGMVRSLLSHAHGVEFIGDDPETRIGAIPSVDMVSYVESTLGCSHADLNRMATEYQDGITRRLDRMQAFELIDGECDEEDDEDDEEMEEDEPENTEEEEILTAGSLTSASVPEPVLKLAEKLSKKHGPVTIASEASGLQIYIPDPELLHTDGMKELYSKHLAVNADRYLGLDSYDIDLHPTKENKALYTRYRSQGKEVPSAFSMKTRRVYMVSDLLAYMPISKRSTLFEDVRPNVVVGSVSKRLVYDEYGNLVPEWCGHTIPLRELASNHPAIEYLHSRDFIPSLLEDQFECCYCDEALPESRGEGRFYSRLPGGMTNSPQGRIIFVVRMNGVRVGYQSRIIDKWVGSKYYVWAPSQRWMLIRERLPDGSLQEVYEANAVHPKGFAPHKYLNAVGSERNKLLMGFDAAVKFNSNREFNRRYCLLVEGPLDAARIGPPALALLGKSMSKFQADAIRKNFSKVVAVMDNDTAGKQCLDKIYTQLPNTPIQVVPVPDTAKDIGELSYMEAYNLLLPYDPEINKT